jgi:hypothetical protein
LNRAQLRPAAFSKWVLTRRFHAPPEIEDLATFANEWLAWWNDNQPKWRQVSISGSLPLALSVVGKKDNLACLRKGGPSGIVTLLIALKWWAPIRDRDERWVAAVNDVRACLNEMMEGNKRKGVHLVEGSKKKRKTS